MTEPGYHLAAIPRGQFGEASKIVEEALELQDACEQQCRVMQLVEASDLFGALVGWLAEHHPDMSVYDLAVMAGVTARAFQNGQRAPR